MIATVESRGAKTLGAAIGRVERFSRPVNGNTQESNRVDNYDDYNYVDCPYDDYQDYDDAPAIKL